MAIRMKQPQQPFVGRFLVGVFGLVFGGIGVAVLIFLWSGGDEFGAPPLFFRVVGSFIAIAFVAFGGTMALSALTHRGLTPSVPTHVPPPEAPAGPTGYACTRCGAPLAQDAEVSPLGDVKCGHCGAWFNIHGRGT